MESVKRHVRKMLDVVKKNKKNQVIFINSSLKRAF